VRRINVVRLSNSWSSALLLPLVAITGCGGGYTNPKYPLVYVDSRARYVTAAEEPKRLIRVTGWMYLAIVPVIRMSDGADAIVWGCRTRFRSVYAYDFTPYEEHRRWAVKIARQQCLEDAERLCGLILNDARATFALMDQITEPDEVTIYARCQGPTLEIEKLRSTAGLRPLKWEDLE
jgi:hypothetical protein